MPGAFILDDLDGMLSTEEHAATLLVTAGPLTGQSFVGIFNAPASDAFNVIGSSPEFHAKSSLALVAGTVGTIAGEAYRLKEGEPDGAGMTRWRLTAL